MQQNRKKNEKGFTLIELIIVIAIMGILAAVLVPSFTQMTAKARVSADLASVKTLQRQLDLYVAEHGGAYPNDGTDKKNVTIVAVLDALINGQYIEEKGKGKTKAHERVGLQSGAPLVVVKKEESSTEYVFKLTYTANGEMTDKILEGLKEGPDKNFIINETEVESK